MIDILWDTDAFLCARSLSLLGLIKQAEGSTGRFWMTGFVAYHELNSVQSEVQSLKESDILCIEDIHTRSPAYKSFQKWRKEPGLHKGEAEAIAWAMERPLDARPLFISNDQGARRGARSHGVPAGDLMDLAVEMIDSGLAAYDDVKKRLDVWNDRRRELCRPGDYDGFDSTYQRRRAQRS